MNAFKFGQDKTMCKLDLHEGGSLSTRSTDSDFELNFHRYCVFLSVCPFVSLQKATYAEKLHCFVLSKLKSVHI